MVDISEREKLNRILNKEDNPLLSDRELLLDIKHKLSKQIATNQGLGIASLIISLITFIIIIIVLVTVNQLLWFW